MPVDIVSARQLARQGRHHVLPQRRSAMASNGTAAREAAHVSALLKQTALEPRRERTGRERTGSY